MSDRCLRLRCTLRPYGLIAVGGLALAVFSTTVHAGSVVQIGAYEGSSIGVSYDDDEPYDDNSYFIPHETITGLAKFDPSLGTLIRARMDVTLSWEWSASFDAQGLQQTSPGSPYYASMRLDDLGAQVLFERDDEPGPLYVLDTDAAYNVLLEGGGNVGDGGEVSTGTGDTRGYGLSKSIDYFQAPRNYFISTGPEDLSLDAMSIGVFIPVTAEFHTQNFFDAWGQAAISIAGGEFTLTYDYGISGDATEDGTVGFDDLVVVAQHYGWEGGADWTTGDFTADGNVNFDDLVQLAQNYGSGAPGALGAEFSGDFAADWARAMTLAPEPTTFAAIASAFSFLSPRRRSGRR